MPERNDTPARISVVIPAYNAASVLARAVTSVMDQTYKPLEIIVIDDGSRDATPHVAASFGDAVRYVFQPNAGVSVARNVGIAVSRGEWIAFLDADDEWLPEKLEVQARILGATPALAWCCSNAVEIVNGRAESTELPADLGKVLVAEGTLQYFEAARRGLIMQTSGFVIRRSVFEDVGEFDPAFRVCQDRDLWWRIALKYPTIGYTVEPKHRYYTDTPDSLTKTTSDRSENLLSVCQNLQRAARLGPAIYKTFAPYAQGVGFDYLRRHASKRVAISDEVVSLAERELALTSGQRCILAGLRRLPARPAEAFGRMIERF